MAVSTTRKSDSQSQDQRLALNWLFYYLTYFTEIDIIKNGVPCSKHIHSLLNGEFVMDHKPTDIVVRSNYQKGVPNWQQGDNTPKSLPIKSTNWIRWGGRRPAPDIDDNDIIDVEYRPVDDNRTGTRPTTGDRMRSLQ